MNPQDFTAAVTHTVLYMHRDGGKYQHRITGRIAYSVSAALDCGHVQRWQPLGDDFRAPMRGDSLMCATCIEAELAKISPRA